MSRTLHPPRPLRTSLGVALVLAAAGCGHDPAPARISLARGFVPPGGADLERAWSQGPEPITVHAEDGGRTIAITLKLPRAAWRAEERSGAELHEWSAACPLIRTVQHFRTEEFELELGGARVKLAPDRKGAEHEATSGTAFFHEAQRLVLLAAEAQPPRAGSVSCRIARGEHQDGTWRAFVQELAADGLSIWPGERWETEVEVAPGSALRFATVARSLGREGRAIFRVTCEGARLEHEQPLADTGLGDWHTLPLPSGSVRLLFEVEGDPSLTAFLDPWVGPLSIGAPAQRPWKETRPNVVLFVADTFRADLLDVAGGPALAAPDLDRIAARSLAFPRMRSPATWTLPAHSSLFTGLFPTQHGAVNEGRTFSPALVTLAEHLERAGYRTAAVTDAGFVSRQYGLDQGFEIFLEHNEALGHRLAKTLHAARELLARDDGRPVFLFVHTYRTHWPYRTGSEEDRSEHDALVARFSEGLAPRERPDPARLEAFGKELLALYRRGASALDEQLGPWFDELERAGFFDPGYFVFTSDHGEAFFEHGKSEHRGMPYEEELRVPLLLFGPGLEAGRSPVDASLLDLAPTLAELCGIPPDPRWCGRSLLAPAAERPFLAWQGAPDKETLAILAGTRKVFVPARMDALAQGEVRTAFELALDPGEHQNVVKQGATWPAELARSTAPEFEPLSHLAAEGAGVEVNAWLKEELAKLGYGGQ